MNHNGIFSLSFPETKTIIVSGDIHETLICWCSNYVSNIRCSTLWSSVKYINYYCCPIKFRKRDTVWLERRFYSVRVFLFVFLSPLSKK